MPRLWRQQALDWQSAWMAWEMARMVRLSGQQTAWTEKNSDRILRRHRHLRQRLALVQAQLGRIMCWPGPQPHASHHKHMAMRCQQLKAQILAALACLLLVAACGVCLRSIMKSRHGNCWQTRHRQTSFRLLRPLPGTQSKRTSARWLWTRRLSRLPACMWQFALKASFH